MTTALVVGTVKLKDRRKVGTIVRKIKMEWINAEKELPMDQEEVLVYTKAKNGVRNVDKGYWSGDRWIHRDCAKVTHWMPLPALPEGR